MHGFGGSCRKDTAEAFQGRRFLRRLEKQRGKTALADVTPRGIQHEPWRDGLRIFTELFHFFLIFQFPSAGRRRLRAAGASKAVVGGHFHK